MKTIKKTDWLPEGARAALAKKDTKGTVIRCPMPGAARGSFLDLSKVSKAGRIDAFVAFLRAAGMLQAAIDSAMAMNDDGAGDLLQSWTLSTARVDSYKDSIDPEGWGLDDFKRNPVVLFAHKQDELPVGRDLGAFSGSGSLKGITRFTSQALNPFGHTVGKLVGNGFLNATSVGFEPDDYEVAEDREGLFGGMLPAINFKKQRLREYSIVPVPANADALADGRAAIMGLNKDERAALVSWCEKSLDLAGSGPMFVPRSVLEAVRKDAGGDGPKVFALAEGVVAIRAPSGGRKLLWASAKHTHERADVDPPTVSSGPPTEIAPTTTVKCPTCGYSGPVSEFTNKLNAAGMVQTDVEAKCPKCGAHFEVAQAIDATAPVGANTTNPGSPGGATNTSAPAAKRDGSMAPMDQDTGMPADADGATQDSEGDGDTVNESDPAQCPQCGYQGTVGDFVIEPQASDAQIQMASELPTAALVAALQKRGALEERPDAGGGVDGGSSAGDPSPDVVERVARIAAREVRRQVTERTGRLP